MDRDRYDITIMDSKKLRSVFSERKRGLRITEERGYDVIHNDFFVYESVIDDGIENKEKYRFKDFSEYFKYLKGDIYNNSIYYQMDCSKYDIDIQKVKKESKPSIIDYTIDDCMNIMMNKRNIKEIDKKHREIDRWKEKINKCTTSEELEKVVHAYYKSKVSQKYNIPKSFFLYEYIYHDIFNEDRFNVIMDYINKNYTHGINEYSLMHIYNPEDVVKKYKYDEDVSIQTQKVHERRLKNYYEEIKEGRWNDCNVRCGYNKKCDYFYEKKNWLGVSTLRFFETFEEFIEYRKFDLVNTDLSELEYIDFEFDKCKINDTTILPIKNNKDIKWKINKFYDGDMFHINVILCGSNGKVIKEKCIEFEQFFDFVHFLKGDLSEADLLLCDGMINLLDIADLNIENAKLSSSICNRFNIAYEDVHLKEDHIKEFDNININEKETKKYLDIIRKENQGENTYPIYYISDIHLLHKFVNYGVKSEHDCIRIIEKVVYNILNETSSYDTILIGGDVSSEYMFFEAFIRILAKNLENRDIVFCLGNHELWDFEGCKLSDVISKYEKLILDNGMYLLHNNIIYRDRGLHTISTDEILQLSEEELREKTKLARMILFGGIGFAGYNDDFNANKGIYRNCINRKVEKEETYFFVKLYEKIKRTYDDNKVIILTHMPLIDWYGKEEFKSEYIYVSGHTHKNYFYDDCEIRIYSDNQIGYYNNISHMKFFELDKRYDYFVNYKDGIYEISVDDYRKFYDGKNIMMTYNRRTGKTFMVKKNGYYSFFYESPKGGISQLNGGSLNGISSRDLKYYYDNMDIMIDIINEPMNKYTSFQKKISEEIKRIGGDGRIHGCIVDISFFEHLYINPLDYKITAYSATDIIDKRVYKSVAGLLKKECPDLYENYKRIEKESSNENSLLIVNNKVKEKDSSFIMYLDTNIYRVSKLVKKMQRLESNILTYWNYEEVEKRNSIKKIK